MPLILMVLFHGQRNTENASCFISKEDIEYLSRFFLDRLQFIIKENFDFVWGNLQFKITISNPTDGIQIANYITDLNRQNKEISSVGGLSLFFSVFFW